MNDFKSLQIIYFALLIGQLGVAVFLIFATGLSGTTNSDQIFRFIVPIMLVGGIFGSYLIYNKKREEGAALNSLEEKVFHYRTSTILRCAIMEGVVLTSLVFFFLEGGASYYLLFAAIGLAVFFTFRPTIAAFTSDYKLSRKEEEELDLRMQ